MRAVPTGTGQATGVFTIPRYAPKSGYILASILCTDKIGNALTALPSNIAVPMFEQVGQDDTVPPVISNVSSNVMTADTSSSAYDLLYWVNVSDAGTGVSYCSQLLVSAERPRVQILGSCQPVTQVVGLWSCRLPLPQGAPAGFYNVTTTCYDKADNMQTFTVPSEERFRQVGAGDDLAPAIANATWSPASIGSNMSNLAVQVSVGVRRRRHAFSCSSAGPCLRFSACPNFLDPSC